MGAFERTFWLNLQEEIMASYAAAHQVAEGGLARLEHPEKIRFRPQARHYFLNGAFRRAASNSGLQCVDAVTQPKGENYCIIESAGIKISRVGMNHNERFIRSAKHRELIAELNSELEGYTPDFFVDEDSKKSLQDTLGVLIINVNPALIQSQDRMLDLRVTVPFTNLKGFHYNQSVTKVLELYNSAEEIAPMQDLAIPKLKERLRKREG